MTSPLATGRQLLQAKLADRLQHVNGKRAAPLMILAAGQLFVIVSGEFDLSVGSLVTAVVVAAAGLTEGVPDRTGGW